jgi:exopolysaccharide production protein ExoZ
VICSHAIQTASVRAGSNLAGTRHYAFGQIGVQIFFVISGFVMILSHYKDFGVPKKPEAFIRKRISRIIPLYWLTSLIYLTKQWAVGSAPGITAVVLSLLFIPHQEAGETFGWPLYGLGWTLEYEMGFYLIFAIGLFWKPRYGISFVILFFVELIALSVGADLNSLTYFGQPIVGFFIAGMIIGLLRAKIVLKKVWRPNFETAVALSLTLSVMGCAIAYSAEESNLIRSTIVAGLCVAAAATCALADESRRRGTLEAVAKSLGDATYSIYLTHSFVIGPAGRLAGFFWPAMPAFLFAGMMIPVCCVIGVLTYRYVEKPMVMACFSLLSRSKRAVSATQ